MITAHVFLAPYMLPVPFWLYLYGCAATLILSFALLALLATSRTTTYGENRRMVFAGHFSSRLWRVAVVTLRVGALAALGLTMAAGWCGPPDPALNVAMTLFWVWFLLAFAYLTAIVGDLYAWISPWKTLASVLGLLGIDLDPPRLRYPPAAAYWPAVAAYIALVWIELFALPRPSTLSIALASYTGITLAGMYLFGSAVWLQYGEMFGVLFRVIGTLAPVEYLAGLSAHVPRVALRVPLSGVLQARAEHSSLVVFILFFLSSTTYDTVHETYLWVSLYWQRLLPVVQPLWGGDVVAAQVALTKGYWWYQWLGLVASPLLYLAFYVGVLSVTRVVSQAGMPLRALSGSFAFSFVPIAVAYHATHYAPSMLMQLPALLPQLADPFYRGWEWLPVAAAAPAPLPMAVVWHTQVFVLLAGHVAAVYVAHIAALRVFPTRSQGIASQVPMLALMVAYTFLGLWALSLPLGVPQIVPAAG